MSWSGRYEGSPERKSRVSAPGSVPDSVLFSHSISESEEDVDGKLIRFEDDAKLGGIVNTLDKRHKIQKYLDRLE